MNQAMLHTLVTAIFSNTTTQRHFYQRKLHCKMVPFFKFRLESSGNWIRMRIATIAVDYNLKKLGKRIACQRIDFYIL